MNDCLEILKTRRSCRSFRPEPISQAELDAILEAGLCAPSGRGIQTVRLVVITNRKILDELAEMNAKFWDKEADPFYGAPELVLVLADRTSRNYIYDGALAMGNMLNAAHALGIGACWINRARQEFDSPRGKELLKEWGIEGDFEGIGHCILGYPARPVAGTKPIKENRVFYVK